MNDIVGITRVRNESLIIADTIRHFLGYCSHIVLYDDCSTDDTVEIASGVGGNRITVINGDRWHTEARKAEETRHRKIALDTARSRGAEWCLCFDADERLVGDLPDLSADGYRFRLFDGYLTPHRKAYYNGQALDELQRMWGPEYRDILMLFKASKARYIFDDQRQPFMRGETVHLADIKVKHYGKCLSVEHWEETCKYYSTYFPEPFESRWKMRKGKAIHTRSDFGRHLHTWRGLMNSQSKWVAI